MKITTMCVIKRENELLLAIKKRGFGMGKWNSVGGKIEPGESIRDACAREITEEVGIAVDPDALVHVGILDFYYENKPEWEQRVMLFCTERWVGQPRESDEMRPRWFTRATIPYDAMWKDDPYWLPDVLDGKSVQAEFHFSNDGNELISYKINRQAALAL